MSHSRVPSFVAWAAPLGVAALLAVFGFVGPVTPAATPAVVAPLDRVTYGCSAEGLTVAAGQLRAGTRATAQVFPDGSGEALQDPERWRTADLGTNSVVVTQTGAATAAVGFVGGVLPARSGGGLVVAPCPGVNDTSWFIGAGSERGHTSALILTNTSDAPAVASVRMWGQQGPIEVVNAEGIVVDPGTTRRINLRNLGAGEDLLAVRVDRVRGAFTATLRDARSGAVAGSSLIDATVSPRRSQVLGPFTSGPGRTMVLANPTDRVATVDVTALGPDGAFVPTGLDAVRVQPGNVNELQLPADVVDGELSLSLRSNVSVAASLRIAATATDITVLPAGPALSGPAVVPVALDEGRIPQLMATAIADDDAKVEVEAFDADMRSLGTSTTQISAQNSRPVSLPGGLDAEQVAYMVVRPSGRVAATAMYSRGDRMSLLLVRPAPAGTAAPVVRPRF